MALDRRHFLMMGGIAGGAAFGADRASAQRQLRHTDFAALRLMRLTPPHVLNVMDYIPSSLHEEILSGQPVTPVTSYVQNAIDSAIQGAGHSIPVVFPSGTFLINDTLYADSGLGSAACSLIGAGALGTTIRANTISQSQPMILYEGGSGSFAGVQITGFRIIGHDVAGARAGIGVKIAGKGGVRVSDCFFDSLHCGVRFSNQKAGPFTEFCVCERSFFDDQCVTAIEYVVDGGHPSFHGSGVRDCRIKTRVRAIYIGAEANVYNAPLDVTVFANVIGETNVIWNDSTVMAKFKGHIGVESQHPQNITALSRGPVVLMGSIYAHDERVSRGSLRQASDWQVFNVNDTPFDSPFYLPISSSMPLVRGASAMSSLPIGEGGSIVSLNIRGVTPGTEGYSYRAVLHARREPGSSGVVTIVSSGPGNPFMFGAPSISLNNDGELIITNHAWPGGEIFAFATVTQTGRGSNVSGTEFGHP